jgi:hypothetical protein
MAVVTQGINRRCFSPASSRVKRFLVDLVNDFSIDHGGMERNRHDNGLYFRLDEELDAAGLSRLMFDKSNRMLCTKTCFGEERK